MNKNLAILFGVFLVVVVAGMAYAADDKNTEIQATEVQTQTPKNMTYGQCISENAAIKNSCYAAVKGVLGTCKTQAQQDASKKDASKQCNQTYKTAKKQCKIAFKSSKTECKKIKHNFLETIGSSLK
jgi:hypothetical protein